MKLARKADTIAGTAFARGHRAPLDPDLVRSWCDAATASDLSPSALDRLEDMVLRRLRKLTDNEQDARE